MAAGDFLTWDDPDAEVQRTVAIFDQDELDRHEALDVLADEYPDGADVLKVIQPRSGVTVVIAQPHETRS